MTSEEATNLQKALREHAGECWQVDVRRTETGKDWEMRITPNYFGVVVIDPAWGGGTRGETGALLKIVLGQLDGMRQNMVDDLAKTVPE